MQNGKAEQPVWTRKANGANKNLVLHVQLRCGSLSITTPVSHLANEFDVSKWFARATELGSCQSNACLSWGYGRLQKSKDSLQACVENVNILKWIKYKINSVKFIGLVVRRKLSSGFLTRLYLNHPAQLQRLARKWKVCYDNFLLAVIWSNCAGKQVGLRICCLQAPKTGFLASRAK